MANEKVTVNVKLTINEYDKFTFTETLEKVEPTPKPRLVVPYTFPLSTNPKYCW